MITILKELFPQWQGFLQGKYEFLPTGHKAVQHTKPGGPRGSHWRFIFCAKFVANQHAKARALLSRLQQVGSKAPQVAYLLLHFCGSFCKMVHMARSTPPSLVAEALGIFDLDIRRCFTDCTSVDILDVAWQQAQLNPSRGGLGLRSLFHHSSACFIVPLAILVLPLERTTTWSSPLMSLMATLRTPKPFVYRTFMMLLPTKGIVI